MDAMARRMFLNDTRLDVIAAKINKRFGIELSPNAVGCHCASVGLTRHSTYRRPSLVWTQRMDRDLREQIANRVKYVNISTKMTATHGKRVSYSAIVNQAFKLAIVRPSRHDPETMLRDVRREAEDKHQRRLAKLLNFVPGQYRNEAPLILAPDVVTDPRNLGLADITRDDCHWITNDDLTEPRYCGHPIIGKGSWCPAHHAVVHQ